MDIAALQNDYGDKRPIFTRRGQGKGPRNKWAQVCCRYLISQIQHMFEDHIDPHKMVSQSQVFSLFPLFMA